MVVHPRDSPQSPSELRAFVRAQGFGQIVAAGDRVWLHLARPNPIWTAITENPRVVLAVAGDWAYVPSGWKTIGDEDPAARSHLPRRI
jgi:transcriptional regulator